MILEEITGGIKIKHPGMPWAGKVIISGSEAPVRFALAGVCPDGGRWLPPASHVGEFLYPRFCGESVRHLAFFEFWRWGIKIVDPICPLASPEASSPFVIPFAPVAAEQPGEGGGLGFLSPYTGGGCFQISCPHKVITLLY